MDDSLRPGHRYGLSLLDGKALRHIGPVRCLDVTDLRARVVVEKTGEEIQVEVQELVRVDLIR